MVLAILFKHPFRVTLLENYPGWCSLDWVIIMTMSFKLPKMDIIHGMFSFSQWMLKLSSAKEYNKC